MNEADCFSTASDADYVAAACFLSGAGLSLLLLAASLLRGARASPAQFAYYFAATLCDGVTLRYRVTMVIWDYILSTFILEYLADGQNSDILTADLSQIGQITEHSKEVNKM